MKREGVSEKVVGRAELKLLGAVEEFRYDFRGKTVLDIGSSTGGFTELALRRGAKKVIAIEKGTKQMKAPLRFDRRVELYEKTDFLTVGEFSERITASDSPVRGSRTLSPTSLRASNLPCTSSPRVSPIDPSSSPHTSSKIGSSTEDPEIMVPTMIDLRGVEAVVADVSFISLRKILAHARKVVPRGVDYLVMLKPQFEAYPDQLVRGVVKNEKIRREIIRGFEEWLGRNGFRVIKKRDNAVAGKRGGNVERFYWLKVR